MGSWTRSDNLLNLDHQADLKSWADELWKLATANTALHLVLTEKSELNLNDGDGGGRGKKEVWCRAPMVDPEVFRKQMYCAEESTCDIVGTFRRPHNSFPRRYAPALHRRILTSHAFLYCVKRSVHENRLIKPFTRARWSQSHTNNECFKLVEALLQIYSCFFSHTIGYNYTWLAAISSLTVSLHYLPRCLCSTAHAGLPFSDFK